MKTLPFLFAAALLPVGVVSADSYTDDFSGYETTADFNGSWFTYVHPSETAAGSAMLDSTADAVILTAEQADGGSTFTLTQLLNLKHKHRLGPGRTVSVEAEFDDAGGVPAWAPESIAPSRVGLSGQGTSVWGQVGVVKQGDPKGTLVAKVAVNQGGGDGEVVVHEVTTKGFGTYDGKALELVVTPETLDLLVGGESVIDGPQDHGIDWSSAIGTQDLQAFVQQQRVFAPQPRSSTVYRVAVEESE